VKSRAASALIDIARDNKEVIAQAVVDNREAIGNFVLQNREAITQTAAAAAASRFGSGQ